MSTHPHDVVAARDPYATVYLAGVAAGVRAARPAPTPATATAYLSELVEIQAACYAAWRREQAPPPLPRDTNEKEK
ncbi:hypothetical protein [Gordonia sputi]|uniref:hypothetical protein n=1 Tax=Gordonia sputi TaxID=36823 RepID=UPI0036D13DE5